MVVAALFAIIGLLLLLMTLKLRMLFSLGLFRLARCHCRVRCWLLVTRSLRPLTASSVPCWTLWWALPSSTVASYRSPVAAVDIGGVRHRPSDGGHRRPLLLLLVLLLLLLLLRLLVLRVSLSVSVLVLRAAVAVSSAGALSW